MRLCFSYVAFRNSLGYCRCEGQGRGFDFITRRIQVRLVRRNNLQYHTAVPTGERGWYIFIFFRHYFFPRMFMFCIGVTRYELSPRRWLQKFLKVTPPRIEKYKYFATSVQQVRWCTVWDRVGRCCKNSSWTVNSLCWWRNGLLSTK